MKRIAVLLISTSLFLVGCNKSNGPTHYHTYGNFYTADENVHERICECGDILKEEHRFDQGHTINEATHIHDGEKEYRCVDCGYAYSIVIPMIKEHVFNQAVINEHTLKEKATCAHPAVYYLSCSCGEISKTETFFYGNPAAHKITGGLKISGNYKQSYYGGEQFDIDNLVVKAFCESEQKEITLSKDELKITYEHNETGCFSCNDTSIRVSLKDNSSIYKDIAVVCDHKADWDYVDEDYDILTCTVCKEEMSKFKKTLDDKNPQIIVMSEGTRRINLTGISTYQRIVSIYLGNAFLGTNINSLNLSAFDSSYANYKGAVQYITVVVEDLLGVEHTISVPVKLVTKTISNESELKAIAVGTGTPDLVTEGTNHLLKGVYVQTQDIVINNPHTDKTLTFNWNYAFGGTYDGNGYTITTRSSLYGIFSNAINATFNDMKVIDTYYTGDNSSSVFAKATYKSSFNNVDVTATGCKDIPTFVKGMNYGAFCYGKAGECTFSYCDFDYSGMDVAILLSCAGGTMYNNFVSCSFKCNSYKAINANSNAGDDSFDVYTHPEITIQGTLIK